jgi:hypothetical protein
MKVPLLGFLLLGCCIQAVAGPITYTISGTATGSVRPDFFSSDETPFTNQTFTFTLLSDTGLVSGFPTPDPTVFFSGLVDAAGVSVGALSGTMTSVTGLLRGDDTLSFFNQNPVNTILALSGSALSSYNLTTDFGPVDVGGAINPNSRIEGLNINTTFGDLVFSSVSDITFTAVTATPEPKPALLFVLGALLLSARNYGSAVLSRLRQRYQHAIDV